MNRSELWLISALACIGCGANFEASGAGGASNVGTSGGESGTLGGGQSGGDNSAGGSPGSGGASSGGTPSSGGRMGSGTGGGAPAAGAGGSAGAADCASLQKTFQADVERARACDLGSTNECSVSSSFPSTCGCPIYVNAKSNYTVIAKRDQKAIEDANCHYAMCAIACQAATSVACALSTTTTGSSVCTASGSLVMN